MQTDGVSHPSEGRLTGTGLSWLSVAVTLKPVPPVTTNEIEQNHLPTTAEKLRHASIKSVAAFEFTKGVVALVGAFALLTLLHRDVAVLACRFAEAVHLNPDWEITQLMIRGAERMSDSRIWMVSGLALVYTAVRFIEGYGLWFERAWAEWFAIAATGVYVPVEVYELFRKNSPLHWVILLVNIAILLLLVNERRLASRRHKRPAEPYTP